jgi:hypothetical protein
MASIACSRRVERNRGGLRNASSAHAPPALSETAQTARRTERPSSNAVHRRGLGTLGKQIVATALRYCEFRASVGTAIAFFGWRRRVSPWRLLAATIRNTVQILEISDGAR